MLSYQQARELVISRVGATTPELQTESVPLLNAVNSVLAQDILADRDYPPFDRSIRDGYAVRAVDTHPGASLRCIGELKAGDTPATAVQPGTCIQIMTGAALPEGADAVIMVEHAQRHSDMVTVDRAVSPGQHVVPRGTEQASGKTVLTKGARLGFAQLAAAAQVGAATVAVYRRPRIAILSTGDEVVDFTATPGPFQIRNSNSVSLTAQVAMLHAEVAILGNANDTLDDLRAKIAKGLASANALILSGGVSAGKYDLVEPVLREFGAETVFDSVAIRPGKPVARVMTKDDIGHAFTRRAFGRPPVQQARFKPGDRVRTKNIDPTSHTRLPRYARGREGVVEAVRGCHVFPDSVIAGRGEDPQWLYTVVFDGQQLWGANADVTLTVSVEAFEPYLDPA